MGAGECVRTGLATEKGSHQVGQKSEKRPAHRRECLERREACVQLVEICVISIEVL